MPSGSGLLVCLLFGGWPVASANCPSIVLNGLPPGLAAPEVVTQKSRTGVETDDQTISVSVELKAPNEAMFHMKPYLLRGQYCFPRFSPVLCCGSLFWNICMKALPYPGNICVNQILQFPLSLGPFMAYIMLPRVGTVCC